MATTGRFAPSPTGRMHLGNIFCALFSWLSARSEGGEWLLRIEDLDHGRSRREFAEAIENDLRWLGLVWDGDPCFQSRRDEIYRQHLEILESKGLVYPCHCTRADIMATQAPHESDGRIVYAGTCRPRRLGGTAPDDIAPNASRQPSKRLFVPSKVIEFNDLHYGHSGVNLAEHVGDFVLQRGDGAWAYQLAVVVDDALTGVNQVVRGRDLLLSSPQQIYLYELFGYEPPVFAHLPLLCNQAGQRLCKRDRSLDMGQLRSRMTPEELIGHLAHLCGLIDSYEKISARELVPVFSWNNIPLEDIAVPEVF